MIPPFLIGYSIVCLVVIFVYLKFNLHLNDKYKFIIDLSVALFGFLTIFILIQQQNFNNITARNEESKIYNEILTEMFTDSLDDFILNKDIQYFYNELFNNIKPDETKMVRNKILEEIICFKILAAYGNYAAYYYSHIKIYEYKKLLEKHNYRAEKILKTLLKSDTFKAYLQKYLKDFAGKDLEKYLKDKLEYSV
jgi:hypothetical protein